ncbi:glutathione S-transferase [Penicillium capsulatum]|uniref:Glutathione S-transferase n=1 Tax=Penicillium capsulatum TaxID=69766 RepID=A0A9W9LYP6_9EURO|nr:glutathione S-transferase [Penicillium capsulatum]KAJ6130817.1 glutathione S-transferase [Penicillium capsulatum]
MSSTTPVYHYFELGRLGRGEVLYLFLKDAGIEIKEVRYPYDDSWAENSKKLQQRGITRPGKLPALEYQGTVLTQHIPILRFFARDLGRYDGETNAEKFVVDAVSDIYIDWRSQWVANLTEKSEKYRNEVSPGYYKLLGQYYEDRAGPYLLGDKVTYADFAVYQSIDNDERTGTLPPLPKSLITFRGVFEQRPNIAAYIRENLQT